MKNQKNTHKEEITRNEAIKKMGKYAALTALGTFLILNPKKAQAQSGPAEPGGSFFRDEQNF
tara:strand:+ start:132 stop:317 length:186 start_codon:yes stop_codon:yes gene_type:complete